jgi:hypothetical protein
MEICVRIERKTTCLATTTSFATDWDEVGRKSRKSIIIIIVIIIMGTKARSKLGDTVYAKRKNRGAACWVYV